MPTSRTSYQLFEVSLLTEAGLLSYRFDQAPCSAGNDRKGWALHSAASATFVEDCDLSTGENLFGKEPQASLCHLIGRAAEAESDIEFEIADDLPPGFEPAEDLVRRSPACR